MKRREQMFSWSVAGVGVVFFLVASAGTVFDREILLIDAVERSLPVVVAVGLVAFNVWLRRRRTAARDVAFVALGTVVAAVLFMLSEVWTLFVLSLEAPVPDETDYIFLNGGALGALAGGVLTYQYRRLQHERDTMADLSANLRRTNEQLHDKVTQLDEFARVTSHDLHNPLNVAQGYLELARETGKDEHFRAAAAALNRAEDITTGMLRLAREGKSVDELKPVSLGRVTREAWSTVDTGDVSLEMTVETTVEADSDRLRQLFENLFRNAVEHGGENLTTVRVDAVEPDGFAVEDDGVGIDPESAESLFVLGNSTKSDGTGYGLSIVRSIANAHEWSVTVTNGPRGGARFEFTDVAFVDTDEGELEAGETR